MGKSTEQTVGYCYFMGLHMVIAKSADALIAIRAGDRPLFWGTRYSIPAAAVNGHFGAPYGKTKYRVRAGWLPTGATGPVVANERIGLFRPDLFGGQDREGGIMGALDVMFGEATQTANDYLEANAGPQPAYRGTFGAVFRGGLVGALNPYLKPWQWRVRRNLKGWQSDNPWYPTACEIDVGGGVKCMNPAHMIYQVLTDAEDGMGYPSGIIDDANFRAAADLFKSEGLGLFMKWMQSDTIEAFIQQVADHANAMVVQNPLTSLFQIIPMRGGYDPSTLLTLTPDNATLELFERTTLEETVNEITVKWDDTFTLNEGSITVQNLANIQAMGGVVNQTKTYAGVPTQAIAQRLAQRDLDISSATLARVRIRANRVAQGVVPGHVVRLQNFSKLGLTTVLVRVLRVKYGGPDRQEITIEGSEDVFGLPSNNYLGTQPGGWVEPDTTPQPSPNVEAFEVSYRDLAANGGASAAQDLTQAAGFLAMVAQRPPGIPMNFSLVTRQGSADYQQVGSGEFAPTALTSAAIGPTDTVIPLTSLSSFGLADVGEVAFLGTHPTAEAVRIDAVSGASVTVARGVIDTTPKAWAAGTRLWVYSDAAAYDPTEYAAGESVDAKALPNTGSGQLLETSATADTVAFNSRAARPYPPGQFKINGAYFPASSFARLAITWAHRDRITQADTIIGNVETSPGPEIGTTYNLRIIQEPSTVLDNQTGLTGTSYTTDVLLGLPAASIRIELEAVRLGLVSWQMQRHVVAHDSRELIVNGGFATDTDWTKGSGWTIAAGVASHTGAGTAALSQPMTLVSGAVYRVEFTVSGYSAGTVRPILRGVSSTSGSPRTANGTYVETMTAFSSPTSFEISAESGFVGSVDNVKVTRLT